MLNPISPFLHVNRRSVPLADATLLDPTESNPLESGEWLTQNSSNQWARVGSSPVKLARQHWQDRGDITGQVLGQATILQVNEYEAETDMYADSQAWSVNQYLTAKQCTIGGATKSGLTPAVQGTDYVYAIVTKIPSANGGKLRYQTVSPYFWAT